MSFTKIFCAFSLVFAFATASYATPKATAESNDSYIFFDLGEVLVHTEKTPQEDGSVKKVVSWMPGAAQYLEDLKQQGYHMGIMSNIPVAWGDAPAEWGTPCESMFRRLDDYMKTLWKEGTPRFDWSYFDHVILPPSEEERKPHPFMYENALGFSCPNKMLYVGDGQGEIDRALDLGISGWLVDPVQEEFFLPTARIPQHIENEFNHQYPMPCRSESSRQCALTPAEIQEVLAREPIPAKTSDEK